MIQFPSINPIAFNIGSIEVHWYGLMYLVGFIGGWWLALYRGNKPNSGWSSQQIADLVFYAALGVIVGGRLGYVLFYNLSDYIAHPVNIFKIWDGGMSFHGGMLGVGVATWIFARMAHRRWTSVIDFVAPLVPVGLAAGRIGNFINGELWGRVTTLPWGIVYPNAGPLPRHPSEIYEFLLEGVALFIILWLYSAKPRPRFAVTSMFLIFYGCFRFFVEFFRQPDPQLNYVAFDWMTMGQLLSLPMIVIGLICLIGTYNYKERYHD